MVSNLHLGLCFGAPGSELDLYARQRCWGGCREGGNPCVLEEGAGSFKGTAAYCLGKLSLFPSTSKEESLSFLIMCASSPLQNLTRHFLCTLARKYLLTKF